ncbi:MAG: uncharacterized protein KVP18_004073 [Porospora cf. gigantea A]|nr:MAG: hypothetical protein KVP18_004073 [Porospora cf. gigantea A]
MSPYSSYVDLSQTEITKTGVELRWKRFQFDKDDYCHLPEVGLSPEDGQISCSSPHFNPALPAQYWYAAVQFLQDCMAVEDPVGKLDAVLNSSCLSGGGRMRHLGIRNAYQKLKRTGSVDDDNAVARAVRSMTSSLPEKDVEELRPVLTACFDLCPPTRQKSVSKVLKARHSELHPPTRQESVSPA